MDVLKPVHIVIVANQLEFNPADRLKVPSHLVRFFLYLLAKKVHAAEKIPHCHMFVKSKTRSATCAKNHISIVELFALKFTNLLRTPEARVEENDFFFFFFFLILFFHILTIMVYACVCVSPSLLLLEWQFCTGIASKVCEGLKLKKL